MFNKPQTDLGELAAFFTASEEEKMTHVQQHLPQMNSNSSEESYSYDDGSASSEMEPEYGAGSTRDNDNVGSSTLYIFNEETAVNGRINPSKSRRSRRAASSTKPQNPTGLYNQGRDSSVSVQFVYSKSAADIYRERQARKAAIQIAQQYTAQSPISISNSARFTPAPSSANPHINRQLDPMQEAQRISAEIAAGRSKICFNLLPGSAALTPSPCKSFST